MEQFKSPPVARRFLRPHHGSRTAVLHADEGWLARIRAGEVDFVKALARRLTEEQMTLRLALIGGATSRTLLEQGGINIMLGGAPAYGPGLLHAGPAHIWGFWYLDEIGTGWHSTIRLERFCPASIDRDKAEYFFNGVTGHMLRENVSRMPQPARSSEPLPPAAAVVFCQEIEGATERQHYLTTTEMLEVASAAAGDETVYVKPHPRQSKRMRRAIAQVCTNLPNLQLADDNIHDLIASARVVVTQNSSCGFEALMQRKPVVLCAKSDFWHAALTARTRSDLHDAIAYAPQALADFEYEKYFYWFLDRKCLEPQKPEFADRALARIRAKTIF